MSGALQRFLTEVERNALLITPSCLPRYGATQTTRGLRMRISVPCETNDRIRTSSRTRWTQNREGTRTRFSSPSTPTGSGYRWATRRRSTVSTKEVVAKRLTGTPGVLEVPVRDGGPSRTRTLDPLIKSHFGQGSIGHHWAEYAAMMHLRWRWPTAMMCVV